MKEPSDSSTRCGIDTVDISRMEHLLRATPPEELRNMFSQEELSDAGEGPSRVARLAARFAAKEACLKLFPRETALGAIGPSDFSVALNGYGAPQAVCSPTAQGLLDRYRLHPICLSLTHSKTTASAVAVTGPLPDDSRLPDRFS